LRYREDLDIGDTRMVVIMLSVVVREISRQVLTQLKGYREEVL